MRLVFVLSILAVIGSSAEAQAPSPGPTFDPSRYFKAIEEDAERRRSEVPAPIDIGVTDYARGRSGAINAYNRAVELARKDKHEPAVQEYAKAIEALPELAEAHYGMGIALYRLRRHDEAVIRFREALRLKPGDRKASAAH